MRTHADARRATRRGSSKTILALAGAVSAALVGLGAPTADARPRHASEPPGYALDLRGGPGTVVRPFTPAEQELFDRASRSGGP